MTARLEVLPLVVWLGGCTLLFHGGERESPSAARDASVPDAAARAPDAAVVTECPDRPLEGRMPEDCLGCGEPCGPSRPFCCAGTCCEGECGSVANTCSS